jgi:carbonic anhydrase/acetyltransferase-like protein (isoleucine patch superfamily)
MSTVDPSVFVAPTATLLGAVKLGASASVWYGAVLRADLAEIVIGESSNVQDLTVIHVDKGSPCVIGPRVSIGHQAILHGCRIDADCLIGMGAVILTGVRIGSGSVIGSGALLPEGMEVPPSSVVMGMPGRVVRKVDEALAQRSTRAWQEYVELAKRHRAGDFVS